MPEQIDETQKLQNIVDKSKTYALAKQSLTPPPPTQAEEGLQIAIIRSLAFSPEKAREIFHDMTGTQLEKGKLKIIDPDPIMNLLGGKRFLFDLKSIAEASFSYFKEEDVGDLQAHFFEEQWPYYWANRIRYNINSMDMGHLKTKLQMFIIVCFNQGKSAKLLNTVGRTFSEEWGSKMLGGDPSKQNKREGFLERINPLKKMV